MPKPIPVKALADNRVWLRYDDGAESAIASRPGVSVRVTVLTAAEVAALSATTR